MRGSRALLGMLVLLAGARASADEFEIPAKYAAAVEHANVVGRLIFAHDVSAARATDELLARKVLEKDSRVRGWLTEQYDAGDYPGILVTFVGEERGTLFALYRVRVPAGDHPLEYAALDPPAPLDSDQVAGWAARKAASLELEKRKDLCGERYNAVVLPVGTAGNKGILVYLLAATSQPDLMIAGGHFLYEYSVDGSKLLSQRAFTRSCIDLPLKGDPEKGEVAALTLSHLLDPTPTEIHVFLNRNYGKSLYLLTTQNKLVWVITDGAIVGATHISKD